MKMPSNGVYWSKNPALMINFEKTIIFLNLDKYMATMQQSFHSIEKLIPTSTGRVKNLHMKRFLSCL